jgi:outer membrane protein TolC
VAGERAVAAARADFERRDQLARSVRVLADNQLRPGAEAARADAERAAAQIRLIQADATLATARTRLRRALGLSGAEVTIDPRGMSTLPANDRSAAPERAAPGEPPGEPPGETPAASPAGSPLAIAPAIAHPLVLARQASIDAARAQETTVARTDLPRVYLQSSVFARGSGASPDGTLDSSTDGLGLDRDNWAVGVQILFPNLFAFSSLRARKAVAAASRGEATALYDETLLAIESERDNAAALLAAARSVAAATPVELEAARQSESQARARYQAGLGTLVDVADAQGLLAHAEVTDQLARIDVWRASLALAVAEGDLGPFVAAVRSAEQP